MYAVIKTGGKQYKVSLGETVRFERLSGKVGDTIHFGNVLMVNNDKEVNFGNPELEGMSVAAEIVGQGKSKKVLIMKKKRRKNYRKTQGHRQLFTAVKILSIGEMTQTSDVPYLDEATGKTTGAASGTITGIVSEAKPKTIRKRTTKTKGSK
ncbi:MAG: 50S ribosomal protein L21 [Nitrospinae bacterium]|nr:50S ribosomal protein L21 [Nitrospinota bacterium]